MPNVTTPSGVISIKQSGYDFVFPDFIVYDSPVIEKTILITESLVIDDQPNALVLQTITEPISIAENFVVINLGDRISRIEFTLSSYRIDLKLN